MAIKTEAPGHLQRARWPCALRTCVGLWAAPGTAGPLGCATQRKEHGWGREPATPRPQPGRACDARQAPASTQGVQHSLSLRGHWCASEGPSTRQGLREYQASSSKDRP